LAQARQLVKDLRVQITTEQEVSRATREIAKAAKANAKAEKAALRQVKQETAIAKAQARLEKLLAKQAGLVGTKAKQAAKRPSKAVVTKFGAEDNAIAAAIMAKKAKV
jgi:hypothetical protein